MITKISLIVAILLVLAGGVTVLNIYNSRNKTIIRNGKVLRMVEGFKYVEPGQNTCMAITPECGYCAGEIIDKKCYEEKK